MRKGTTSRHHKTLRRQEAFGVLLLLLSQLHAVPYLLFWGCFSCSGRLCFCATP